MDDYLSLLNRYLENHTTPEDPLLARINRETHLRVLNPRMLSGALQGKLLEFISRMITPECILEIGTFTGYSAICLAKGLAPGGKLYTIEKNDEITRYSLQYFLEAGLNNRIEQLTGDAVEIIPDLPYAYDLVFIDGEKTRYPVYYKLVIEHVKKGGFIIADNVLWNGKVLRKDMEPDPETSAITEFNEMIDADSRVENIIVPLRDGLNLIRKL